MLTQAEEGEVVSGVLVLHASPLHGLAYNVVHHLDGAPLPEDDLLHCCSVWNPCTCQATMKYCEDLVGLGEGGGGEGREGKEGLESGGSSEWTLPDDSVSCADKLGARRC